MRIDRFFLLTLVVAAAAACGPSVSGGDQGDDAGVAECVENVRRCSGNSLQQCTDGVWTETQRCNDECDPTLGCVLCLPGTGTCNGSTSHACRPDGQGFVDEYCDPVMGTSCDPGLGLCVGACSATALGQSYIGCEYFPTQTTQLVNPSFQFAVAISNTTTDPAIVTIEGGALTQAMSVTVQPGQVAVQRLPWVAGLKRCMTEGSLECGAPQSYGGLAVNGAYHLRSTRPVTVYQFSPLDYFFNNKYAYSNDASLLLPTNAWTGTYVVPGWQAWVRTAGTMPGTMAITAHNDNTMVQVTTRTNTRGGDGAPSFTAGVPQTLRLDAGDVLLIMNDAGDLTGSQVNADKPVQVVAGHHCTQLPIGYTACDHIEESIFPVEALSNGYLVTAPYLPSTGGPRQQVTRIVATRANTQVQVTPAIGGPYTLAQVGDFVEIAQRLEDLYVTADAKIVVTHYMESQNAPPAAGTGDPAMTLSVPIDQYRTHYQFHAPTNYDGGNFVNVTARVGTAVQLDGAAVTGWTTIPGTEFAVARVPLSNSGNGNHTAVSDAPFGITVYGYGQYTSYWYPGGLDLTPIPVD
jgi:hypothetical protein